MIEYNKIKQSFAALSNLDIHSRNIIKEALQYKALEIINNSKFSNELVFIGGTNLRILHDIKRFSEDLDFDITNETYNKDSHIALLDELHRGFKKEGYDVDFKMAPSKSNTLTGKLVFPGLEYKLGTTPDPRKVVNIKLDAQAQGYTYEPDLNFINRFGVFTHVRAMPPQHIFASKLMTATQRVKGRDLYDIVELEAITKADQGFLNHLFHSRGIKINSNEDIKDMILENIKHTDWNEKTNEIGRFVFDQSDIRKVTYFTQWFKQIDINNIIKPSKEIETKQIRKIRKVSLKKNKGKGLGF